MEKELGSFQVFQWPALAFAWRDWYKPHIPNLQLRQSNYPNCVPYPLHHSRLHWLCFYRAHLRSIWNSAHEQELRHITSPAAVSSFQCQHPTNCPVVQLENCGVKQRNVARYMEWSIENCGAPSVNGRRHAQDLEIRVSALCHCQIVAAGP